MKSLLLLLCLAPLCWAAEPTYRDYTLALVNDSVIQGIRATGSMKPAFDENYLLIWQPAAARPLKDRKIGEVILFWGFVDGKIALICHRIYSISSGGSVAVSKGDANSHTDPGFVTADTYAGLVVGWVRKDLLVSSRPVAKVPRFTLDTAGQVGKD